MSVVPEHGHDLMLKLLAEAEDYPDDVPLPFWLAYFRRAFPELGKYMIMAAESSATSMSRGTDISINKLDYKKETLTIPLVVQCKRADTSLVELEASALGSALTRLAVSELSHVYAVTTFGVTFRAWVVRRGFNYLNPLHGLAIDGCEHEYLEVDDAYYAQYLAEAVNLARGF